MKTLTALVVLLAMTSLAAPLPPGFTGKQINQYPNTPTPGQTNLILLDPGNGAYLNTSVGQLSTAIGSAPFITNNYFVNTNTVIITSNAFINNTYVTNLTVEQPGGLTNLNLTPNSLMWSDVNDAEASIPNASGVLTNNGTGGIGWNTKIILDEIDALNFYPTNMYTFLTNAQYLSTDGNGKVQAGTGLPATNLLLSAGNNITFTTNGSGSIDIAASATNTVSTITNNLFVTTNVIVYDSITVQTNVTVNQNLYVSTNFSTNLYFVSGKGNTLIITNNLSVGGVQTNLNIAASSAVITKADQVLTNAVNVHGVFTNSATGPPSFGLLQNTELQNSSITVQGAAVALGGSTLAVGSKPVFDLQASTNLLVASISSPTNGVSSASAVDFSVPEATTNIAGAVSFTSLANFNTTNYNHAIRYIINRSGSDQTITVGTWETDSARTSATTYTATNNTTLALMFSAQINVFTNVTAYKTFR